MMAGKPGKKGEFVAKMDNLTKFNCLTGYLHGCM
jgi:hypothetical protein